MKAVKIILVNVLVLAVLVLIIDKCLHLYAAKNNKAKATRAIRLREHPPQLNEWVKDTIAFRTDGNAYILPTGGAADASLSMVFLGGSTTECLMVKESSRFPYLVGKQLVNEYGLRTHNAGVSGNCTQHTLNVLLNKVAPQRPDYVVVMHNINDLNIYLRHPDYWSVKNRYSNLRLLDEGARGKWECLLPGIAPKFKGWYVNHGHREEAKFDITPQQFKRLCVDYQRNLGLIKAVCNAFDIRLVLMTQARAFENRSKYTASWHMTDPAMVEKVFTSVYQTAFDSINQLTRHFAHTQEVPLIDLAAEFSEDTALFYDMIHYNNEGSKQVADFISKELVDMLP